MLERRLWYLCNGYYDPSIHAHANVSIVIFEGSSRWDEAYANWIAGKNPTDDPGWNRAVVMSHTGFSSVTGFSYRKTR